MAGDPRHHSPAPSPGGRLTVYSVGEEIAHGVTHGLGIALSIAGLAVLVAFASLRGNARHVVACSIFGATLILLYSASTLYHSIPMPRVKNALRVLDHCAIYLLIAGTYTPFTLIVLRGAWGWTLLAVVWGLAILGILFKLKTTGRHGVLSTVLYIALGWCIVVAAGPLVHRLAPGGLVLLVLGGLSYTAGIAFYAWRRLPYHHAVWHLFVLAGSAFHFFAVLFYVIPRH